MGGHASIVFVLALGAAGCANSFGFHRGCSEGEQIVCECGDGTEGRQTCRSDRSSFGPCLGCDDAAVTPDAAVSEDGAISIDAGIPEIDAWLEPPDAWTEPDTGPSCAWVWLDRGGPPFQPHPCRDGAGVVAGMLVDPEAFFTEVVAGRDPETWETVMNELEAELWSCGVGQQRGSGGDVRGRLFLPTAACPDASPPPGDDRAIFLGVRQEEDCWMHPADVVECR